MPTWQAKMRRQWKVGLAFLAVTVAFVVQGVLLKNLVDDVNRDRLVSCQRTYEGVREVFRPFFTPAPKPTDGKRYRDYVKFNNTVDHLKARCGVQTGVKK